MTSSPSIPRVIIPQPPSRSPAQVGPKRGGIDSVYGLYLGGSALNNQYEPKVASRLTYRHTSQCRNVSIIASIEQQLRGARDSVTTLKFDGRLESLSGSVTELGKDRFLTLLARRVEEHGQETFYYAKNSYDEVVNIITHAHNFSLDMIVTEFENRSNPENSNYEAFDEHELRDIALSRLVVESLLASTFYEKIAIRHGHCDDFKLLPGSGLLMMALETCNASVSHDIEGATKQFFALTLDAYPGENISDFVTKALCLIKIMQGGYALPINVGSRLLVKVSKTSCEEFNRKIFALLDTVKTLEYKYQVLDPLKLIKDPDYPSLGPIGLISTLQNAYGQLIATQDWPAVAYQFPQGNHSMATSNVRMKST
jgi:hypothetical protein